MTTLEREGTDIVDYLKVIWRWRIVLFGGAFAVALVASIFTFFMQKTYAAKVVIMPINSASKGGGLGDVMAQLGGLSVAGMGSGGKGTMLMALLDSRSLAKKVIERHDLMKALFPESWNDGEQKWNGSQPTIEDAIDSLKGRVVFTEDKRKGVFVGTAEFTSPQVAANVANAFVSVLGEYIVENTLTQAKKNRLFIAKQLSKNNKDLLESGKSFNRLYQSGRVSTVDSKIDVAVSESPIDIMIIPETMHNAEQNEKIAKDIMELEKRKNEIDDKIHYFQVVQDVPQQVYLNYLTIKKELLAKINALLTQQYEIAKIEESKEDLTFQVVDYAVPPQRKFKPNQRKIAALSFVLTWILLLFCVFALEGYRKRMGKPPPCLSSDHPPSN